MYNPEWYLTNLALELHLFNSQTSPPPPKLSVSLKN